MSYQTLQTIQYALERLLEQTNVKLGEYRHKLSELTCDSDYETTLYLECEANRYFFKTEDIKTALQEVNEELTIIRYRAEGKEVRRYEY